VPEGKSFRRILITCLVLLWTSAVCSQPPSAKETTLPRRVARALPPGAVARLGAARLPHRVAVTGLAFSPDGKWLASGGGDGEVRLWDAGTLRKVHHLKGLFGSDARVAFSPNGKSLAGAATGGEPGVIVWDLASGKERWRGSEATRALAFSPDGRWLACGLTTGAISLRDANTGKEVRKLEGHEEAVGHLAFLDERRKLASAGRRRNLFIWDVASGKELRRSAKSPTDVLCFSADGKTVVTHPSSDEIVLWDVASGKPGRQLRNKATADLDARPNADYGTIHGYSAAFSPDGKWLAVGATRDHIHLWNLTSGKDYFWVCDTPRARRVSALAFSPDGRTLASGGWDGIIQLWDVGGQGPGPFFAHRIGRNGPGKMVDQLVFSADGKRLVTRDMPEHLCLLWDAESGRALAELPEGTICANGRWLARPPIEGKKSVTISRLNDGKDICRVPLNWNYGVIFSPDGKLLAGQELGGTGIRVADAATGKELRRLVDPGCSLVPYSFSEGGKFLLGGAIESKSPDCRVWDLTSGKEVYRSAGWSGIFRLSPDGNLLAELGYPAPHAGKTPSPRLILRDVASGKAMQAVLFPGITFTDGPIIAPDGNCVVVVGEPDGSALLGEGELEKKHIYLLKVTARRPLDIPVKSARIRAIAFSPDGRTLASAGQEGIVHLWETATGRERRVFIGHTGPVGRIVFSPDGRRLASASEDRTVLVWNLRLPVSPGPDQLSQKELEALWAELAGGDAVRGFRAVQILPGDEEGVAFLGERLRLAAPPISPTRLADLIRDLDNNNFAVRGKASAELEKLGEAAAPALRRALEKPASLEARRRLEALLENCESTRPLSGEELRQLRGVEALECEGSARARQVLEAVAGGAADARATREAQAALKRLRRLAH
jgi:WD40 repeat protein